ncbi:hypothetical protein A1O3_05816 [Capronia epimyces CBS 606.96]|uniref:Uncharacterized protein n=1 Tax=Capronia epimyces CBS 606.96 TaxID=1182542 RepID=W9Y7B5_9EURO|nr:uncharacterized protein A1O3_05816 [Capronia epimyces CBS 606.96]EXJ85141.1 hypothetical protein A1O3_05816 [Capronia epimyces CBS 606.96]
MCRRIQYLFIDCRDENRPCDGFIDPVTVEVCEAAAARGGPPWETGYSNLGLLSTCIPTTEFRYIHGMCARHEARLAEEEEIPGAYDPAAPEHNQFEGANQTQDDFVYNVPQTPWSNPRFREIDWNPAPRPVPLEPPPLSPRDTTEYTHPRVGLLNTELDPVHWVSTDGRPVRPLQTPDDPPVDQLQLPRLPRPQPPRPQPSIPDDFDEQLDDLISEFNIRYPSVEPGMLDPSVEVGEPSNESDNLQGAYPGWQPPPASPPAWEPASPTGWEHESLTGNSVTSSGKRARSTSVSSSSVSSPVNKRQKIMLRFPKATNTESDAGTQPPLKLRLRTLATAARLRLTLNPPQVRKTGIKLRFKLPANQPNRAHGRSNTNTGSRATGSRRGNVQESNSRRRTGRQTSPTLQARQQPALSMQGPMTRSRLRQLQAEATETGPMTRSRLRRLEAEATRPGNRAKTEQLQSFLRHAKGVSR